MTTWDTYPSDYRQAEVQAILAAVQGGECAFVLGLSGSGKSNLLGFMAHRLAGAGLPRFAWLDCNRLAEPSATAFLELLGDSLGASIAQRVVEQSRLISLEWATRAALQDSPGGLCLLIDRFEALAEAEMRRLVGPLRALRDAFKYSLTYVIASRRALEPASELDELFYAHTLHLGPLAASDAAWSARQYAARRGLEWQAETIARLVELSGGYPSMLRAACEAHAAGAPLQLEALRQHPALQRRLAEFWQANPSPEELRLARLNALPLLSPPPIRPSDQSAPEPPATDDYLTASEHRLMQYLLSRPGQVCNKDDLIQAVWSEEAFNVGLRDDSLAQLVRRLRRKIEADPANPQRILTIPGRGYRFVG
jgi:hypothetical protein